MRKEFEKFLKSSFELEIRSSKKIVFRSKKRGVNGLAEFIGKYGRKFKNLTIFDKKVGRGVALLAAYLKAKAIFGKTGSKLAARTLKDFKIDFYFQKTVPHILNREKNDFCPIEKLSLKKTPKEFYNCLKERIKN